MPGERSDFAYPQTSEGVGSRSYAATRRPRAVFHAAGSRLQGPFFQRKHPSLSREGHPTVAHRFNGGKAIPTKPTSPVRDGRRLRKSGSRGRWCEDNRASFCHPCRGFGRERLVVPPLKRWAIVGCPWRDKEWPAVTSCSGEAWDFPVFHTLEALGWRSENPRRMATTLLPRSPKTSEVWRVGFHWPLAE